MNPQRARRPVAAGFTLPELLVALTLLGFVAVLAAGGLGFGARAWERTQRTSAALGDVAAAQAFLRGRLEGPIRAASVSGDASGFAFTALWLTDVGGGGFYRFAIIRGEDESGRPGLVLTWTPADAGDAPTDPALTGRRVLVPGVGRIEVAYYGAPAPDEPAVWRDEWPVEAANPSLLRLRLAFEDARARWPAFTAALAY